MQSLRLQGDLSRKAWAELSRTAALIVTIRIDYIITHSIRLGGYSTPAEMDTEIIRGEYVGE